MAISDPSFSDGPATEPNATRSQLRVQDLIAGGWCTLRLSGELDLASSAILQDAIERIGMVELDGITLDLSKVTFIDSSGVRAVLELQARARQQRTEFRIIPGAPAAQHIFEVTGLLDVLPFDTDGHDSPGA